jgi:hypothetical protein
VERRRFDYPYDTVFEAVRSVLEGNRFRVGRCDPGEGHISAETGVSLTSWGDAVIITVRKIDPGATMVDCESSAKSPVDFLWRGRHRRRCHRLFAGVTDHLAGGSGAASG